MSLHSTHQLVRPVVITLPHPDGDLEILVQRFEWAPEVSVRLAGTEGRWLPVQLFGGSFVEREQ